MKNNELPMYRRLSTGIKGLDDLIGGGLIPGRVYVVTGPPGSGKTTLGMQFLVEGAKNGERGVYISLVDDPKTIIQDMLHYRFNLLSYIRSKRIVIYDLGTTLTQANKKPSWTEILEEIKGDLGAFGVTFDSWFGERTLYERELVSKALDKLKERGFIYEEEGALWFASRRLGDDKDRVVVRANGEPTYLASDIAYHALKAERGFDLLVDVWGADHHGYVPRIRAALEALGYDPQMLQVLLIQMVSLIKGGEKVSMSTRQGEFVPLAELVDEVGKDAVRFIFLTRKCDAHLDFDVDLAKSRTEENPVFYVQYAHARISSIFRTAQERNISLPDSFPDVDLAPLGLVEEMSLIKKVIQFPDLIEGMARSLEPHRLTYYLQELAAAFHSYYNHHRVLVEDGALREARMALVKGIQLVVREGLRLLGVDAPHSM